MGGAGSTCPSGYNPCDPYCYQAVDDPTTGFTAPAGFDAGPSGFTLVETPIPGCTSLSISPATRTEVRHEPHDPGHHCADGLGFARGMSNVSIHDDMVVDHRPGPR